MRATFGQNAELDTPFFTLQESLVEDDNRTFTSMGIRSNMVASVVSGINNLFRVECSVTQLFDTPNVSTLTDHLISATGASSKAVRSKLTGFLKQGIATSVNDLPHEFLSKVEEHINMDTT